MAISSCILADLVASSHVPVQYFLYLGLQDRLQELIEDKNTSELLLLPDVKTKPSDRGDNDVIRNVWDSLGWWNYVKCGGNPRTRETSDFGNNDRNIVLSLHVDGISPFTKRKHSFTPIQAMILNLPDRLRALSHFILLVGIIPDPKAPISYNPYLDIVVEELLRLYSHGFSCLDPRFTPPRPTQVKVKLLYTCADLPAHNSINNQQGHSAKWGCMKCYTQVSPIQNVSWLQLCHLPFYLSYG